MSLNVAGGPIAFSWGYEGWGNHTAALVAQVDAVEDARGFGPPLFVDVRLRRQVRAAGFRDRAFERLLGERYEWMPGLGNLAISGEAEVMTIRDPGQARTLLARVERCAAAGSRVIFFCACGSPRARATCHRGLVATLLVEASRRAGVPLAVQEWPGDAPVVSDLVVPAASLRRLRALVRRGEGTMRLPVPAALPIARAGALPHYSLLRCRASDPADAAAVADPACLAISGPAIMTATGRMFPVHAARASGGEARLTAELDRLRRAHSLEPLGADLPTPSPRWQHARLSR